MSSGGMSTRRGGNKNVKGAAIVSHYHTSEEKPRLQIQEDWVLCPFFFQEEEEGSGELWPGSSLRTTDDPSSQSAIW